MTNIIKQCRLLFAKKICVRKKLGLEIKKHVVPLIGGGTFFDEARNSLYKTFKEYFESASIEIVKDGIVLKDNSNILATFTKVLGQGKTGTALINVTKEKT